MATSKDPGRPEMPAPEPTPVKTEKPVPRMKVRATRDGYYDDILRRPGDVFTIDATPKKVVEEKTTKTKDEKGNKPAAFSEKWMEEVPANTPEQTTSHNEVLRRQHDEEVAARHGRPTGEQNPLGE